MIQLSLGARRLLSSATSTTVVFSGIQPTGVPHLGNYLGAISQWVSLQQTAAPTTKLLISIVDLHSITVPQDPDVLRQRRRSSIALLLACGIDPSRCIIFEQSKVPEHAQLAWILMCNAPVGKLFRMTQWKAKMAAARDRPLDSEDDYFGLRLGLLAYPVLQAADILLYKSTHVPVGEDQFQHLELARSLAEHFNSHIKTPIFPLPVTMSAFNKKIMSLRDPTKKMSKSDLSDYSRIVLTDSVNMIAKKISLSMTDSISGITYDPKERPGVSNLISIYAGLREICIEEATTHLRQYTLKQLKEEVAAMIAHHFVPINDRYAKLMCDQGYLKEIETDGMEKAKKIAEKTLSEVYEAVGL